MIVRASSVNRRLGLTAGDTGGGEGGGEGGEGGGEGGGGDGEGGGGEGGDGHVELVLPYTPVNSVSKRQTLAESDTYKLSPCSAQHKPQCIESFLPW